MKREEIKKTLQEQLELLAEMSKNAKDRKDSISICSMTEQMVSISILLLPTCE